MAGDLFSEHVKRALENVRTQLNELGLSGVVIHSGTPGPYHADDVYPPFKATPHFTRFAPVGKPHALLFITESGAGLVEVVPKDYWEDHADSINPFWRKHYDSSMVQKPEEAWLALGKISQGIAFIGDALSSKIALEHGIAEALVNPPKLLEAVDRSRLVKTPYEVENIQEANRIASIGHKAAHNAYKAGGTEFEIHLEYLKALQITERELPYPTIVAMNERAGILHYDKKRDTRNGASFLIDAGALVNGYASDITRTYERNAHPVYAGLLDGLGSLQQELVERVAPSVPFIEIHHAASMGIAELLDRFDIVREGQENAIRSGIVKAFFPHGVGHMLGIQVHDVGGSDGGSHSLQKLYPKLRTSIALAEGHVTTIEPGIYFIPMLLDPLRDARRDVINWNIVDALIPLGGMRIEDDILVTNDGRRNLTREFLP